METGNINELSVEERRDLIDLIIGAEYKTHPLDYRPKDIKLMDGIFGMIKEGDVVSGDKVDILYKFKKGRHKVLKGITFVMVDNGRFYIRTTPNGRRSYQNWRHDGALDVPLEYIIDIKKTIESKTK